MKPIITRFDKNSGDILLSIPMFDKDIFHRIQQIEKCNPSWFDTEHYNIFDLIKENQSLKKENKILRENAENNDKVVDKVNWENQLLKKENEHLKDNWNKLKEYIRKNIIYDDVGMKILDPSPLEDYIQELEQGSD